MATRMQKRYTLSMALFLLALVFLGLAYFDRFFFEEEYPDSIWYVGIFFICLSLAIASWKFISRYFKIRQKVSFKRRVILGITSLMVLGFLYSLMANKAHQRNPNDTTIPTFSQYKEGLIKMIEPNKRTGERWIIEDSKATFIRYFWGLLAGIAVSMILGFAIGCFKYLEAFAIVPIAFAALIPPTAALAVFFALLGTGLKLYVAVIAFGIVPLVARSIALFIDDISEDELFKAQTLGAVSSEVVLNVIFKQVLPKVIEAIELQYGNAMVFLIAAELLCAEVGIGYRIRIMSRRLEMNVVYTELIILAAFGFAMGVATGKLNRLICRWNFLSKGRD